MKKVVLGNLQKQRYLKISLFSSVFLILTGCATSSYYQVPPGVRIAYLENNYNLRIYPDPKKYNQSFRTGDQRGYTPIPANKMITLGASRVDHDTHGTFSCPYLVFSFTPQENHRYRVTYVYEMEKIKNFKEFLSKPMALCTATVFDITTNQKIPIKAIFI